MSGRTLWPRPRSLNVLLGLGLTSAAALIAYELHRRHRHTPLTLAEWRASLTVEGRAKDFDSLLLKISQQGASAEVRGEVWPYLLQVFKTEWPTTLRDQHIQQLQQGFQKLQDRCQELDFEHQEACARHSPGQRNDRAPSPKDDPDALHAQFARAQQIILLDAVRTRFPAPASPAAAKPKGAPQEPSEPEYPRDSVRDSLEAATHLSGHQRQQALRLVNLLCAYTVHDPEIGYCQGMSDLALPFVVAMRGDALAFWCFAKLMQNVRKNFMHDGAGIRDQLQDLSDVLASTDAMLMQRLNQLDSAECYFAYRMLLVMLRRELSLPQAMNLWEILWAGQLLKLTKKPPIPVRSESSRSMKPVDRPPYRRPPSMLVFVLAAAIIRQRRRILYGCGSADDVMALFATQRIQLWPTVRLARSLMRRK